MRRTTSCRYETISLKRLRPYAIVAYTWTSAGTTTPVSVVSACASAAVQPARHIDAHTAILLSLSRMWVASGTPFISTIVWASP